MDELEAFRESYAGQFDYNIEKTLVDIREFGKRNQWLPQLPSNPPNGSHQAVSNTQEDKPLVGKPVTLRLRHLLEAQH